MRDIIEPHIFEETGRWIRKINREWQFRPPVDLHGSVSPDVVEAASGHTFIITFKAGPELTIPTGGHITMEVPATWDAYLANCFRRGIQTVGNREQIKPGYGAFTDVECSNPNVQLELAASRGRIVDLVDVAVTEGEVIPGDEIRIIMGPPDGNLVQVQKHAQKVILATGVDLMGDQVYRRVATQPTLKVIGTYPDRFRVFAPAVVESGQDFTVRVLPVDIYSYNPATRYEGHAQIFSDGNVHIPDGLDIDTNTDPKGVSATARVSSPGTHFITALDAETGISGRSNPIVADFLHDRRIYFGEMHSQMWCSMGTGTTTEFFEWGRDNAGLDFCAPANHYNWRFEVTDEIWQELVDTCNKFNDPGRFATMVSYEWGGARGSGHKNVYYRGDYGEFAYWYRGEHNSPEGFWESLKGRDVLTVPHHSKSWIDWSYRNDEHQRLVEICSNWDIAEEAGPRSVQDALAMGHRLGFVGGTDSHYGLANQGSYHVNDGNALACVMATELTRDAIWQALYERRCYATTGDRIVLDFSMNGHPMGTDIPVELDGMEPRSFLLRVAGTYRIDLVEIIRNNEVVFSAEPGKDTWEGEWTDNDSLSPIAFEPTYSYDSPFVFYYMRVTQGNRQKAWASPIWLTQSNRKA